MASSRPPPGYVLKNWTTTIDRVSKFISDRNYTNVNLFGKLYPETIPVASLTHYAAPGRITWDEAMQGTYVPASVGDSFGPTWSTHWFKVDFNMPQSWVGQRVEFVWESGSEAMVWIAGNVRQGLNMAHSHRNFYIVSESLTEQERIQTLYVEMAANHLFGAGDGDNIFPPKLDRYFVLDRCDLRTRDMQVDGLFNDVDAMYSLIRGYGQDHQQGYRALYTANEMINIVDHDDRTTYDQARALAAAFFAQTNGMTQHTVCAISNCHIDTAWLWEYDETKRKCARSWSTSMRLMEKYPNLAFAASQAQQYEWVKDNYPDLFAEMQSYNALGRFVTVGGTWVEMDGNVPSGEGFIRQFLVGQRFFEQNFGARCTEFWLPDTFGYSPQLPQIVKLAGIDRFVTQKLSWSLINKFPHNTFWWAGIDGSQILGHFPPGDSYVMQGQADELIRSVDNFKDKGRSNHSLYLYGHGDGGHGPDAPMVERLTRMANVDGLPKVELMSPKQFFERVDEDGTDNINVWNGELYLELHNGTYTTQGKIKKDNRQTEFLLGHIETIGTLAHILDSATAYSYPATELLRLWKLVLCNQFHDILPGTSIQIAHEAAFAYYDDVRLSGGNLLTGAVDAFFAAQNDPSPVAQQTLFNLTSWDRTNVVTIPATTAKTMKKSGKALEQVDKDGNTLVVAQCLSLGYSVLSGLDTVENQPTVTPGTQNSFLMDNGLVQAHIDASGRLFALYINGGTKNTIAEGEFGNQLLMFEDMPMYWDAWDIADYHLETMKAVTETVGVSTIVENGPIRATVKVELRLGAKSTVTQYIMLEAGSKCVKFQTEVDWQESHKCLKVEFPVNVSAQQATYECQYGFLQRPTHMNTSWDWAKYEVFGHKWADLSEYNWGLSVLNDCKYGWSCLGNKLRLSLLRSPKNPDPTSDMGLQTFTYCAFPHDSTFQDAGVIQAAWELNVPLQLHNTQVSGTVPVNSSFVQVDNPSVIVGALKKCEDDDNAFVLRLYEAYGGRGRATVTVNNLPNGVQQAQVCNILEDLQGSPLSLTGNAFSLDFTPFQIQSVKVTFNTPAKGKK